MYMHRWSSEEKEYLGTITPGRSYKEIQELMNKKFSCNFTFGQIKGAVKRYGFKTGRTGRFEKGFTPWNKGLKGVNLGGRETQFKKGQKPHNWVPIGSERITKDGYVQIKVQEGQFQRNWKGKHVIIWEEHNGPLPEGHTVIFADGDIRNFDPTNLISVSRRELLLMNRQGLIKEDPELTKTGALVAKLQSEMYQKLKEDKS